MKEARSYTSITETPGSLARSDQCSMLQTRYALARESCLGRTVLEVGCGSGIGLGFLAQRAGAVVGGDLEAANCARAQATYRDSGKVRIVRLDAEALPFPAGSFDVVILFEALYYIHDQSRFVQEAHRVMRSGGQLIVSSVNCEWSGFNRSPFSTRYLNASELRSLLENHGFHVRVLTGFPDSSPGAAAAGLRLIRWVAIRLRLVPRTMHGKEWLKRMFYGPLTSLPADLPEAFAEPGELVEITQGQAAGNSQMLYAIASRS